MGYILICKDHPSVWHKFISLIYLFIKNLGKVYLKLKIIILKKLVLYKQTCFFFFFFFFEKHTNKMLNVKWKSTWQT